MTAPLPIIYSTRRFALLLLFVPYLVNRFEKNPSIYSATLCLTLGSQHVPQPQGARPLSIEHCQLPDLQFYFGEIPHICGD